MARVCVKRSKVKATGCQKPKKLPHIMTYMFTYGRRGSSADGSGVHCKLGLTIVRLNLLSVSETLGDWTEGDI